MYGKVMISPADTLWAANEDIYAPLVTSEHSEAIT